MAYYGVSKPVIASLDVKAGTYSNGMALSKACGTSVTPNYAEGSIYGDRDLAEHRKRFKNATVEVETTDLPVEAAKILFGHEISEDGAVQTSKTTDKETFVGYGFVGIDVVDDIDIFTACWLPKVKFSEGADSYTAEGENITLSSHKITGTAVGNAEHVWREKKKFSTEEEAYAYLKTKAGITQAA